MRPDPTILAFDTSAAHCAAALLSGGRAVVRVDPMAKGQAEHLMPMLEAMLAVAGLAWRDLDALAVGTGPGNFTGIRIAVSAARGLALGLGKPAIGVDGFTARAHGAARPATVAIPAPRDRHYRAVLGETGFEAGPTMEGPEATDPGAVLPEPSPEALIENVARHAAAVLGQDHPRPGPLYVRAPDAAPPRDAGPVLLP